MGAAADADVAALAAAHARSLSACDAEATGFLLAETSGAPPTTSVWWGCVEASHEACIALVRHVLQPHGGAARVVAHMEDVSERVCAPWAWAARDTAAAPAAPPPPPPPASPVAAAVRLYASALRMGAGSLAAREAGVAASEVVSAAAAVATDAMAGAGPPSPAELRALATWTELTSPADWLDLFDGEEVLALVPVGDEALPLPSPELPPPVPITV